MSAPRMILTIGNQHRRWRRRVVHETSWFLDVSSVSFRVSFRIPLDLVMFAGNRQRLRISLSGCLCVQARC